MNIFRLKLFPKLEYSLEGFLSRENKFLRIKNSYSSSTECFSSVADQPLWSSPCWELPPKINFNK